MNLTGVFLWSQAAGRVMIEQRAGKIVNIASVAAFGGAPPELMNAVAYSASKGGVVSFTRDLATKWAQHGITVNAIAPGPIETSMLEHVRAEPGRWERTIGLIPQRRIGDAGDVVGPVLFLLSPAARYVTGQVVHVNGGMVMP